MLVLRLSPNRSQRSIALMVARRKALEHRAAERAGGVRLLRLDCLPPPRAHTMHTEGMAAWVQSHLHSASRELHFSRR